MPENEFDPTPWLRPLTDVSTDGHLSAREIRRLGTRRRTLRTVAVSVAGGLVVAVGGVALLDRPVVQVANPPTSSPSAPETSQSSPPVATSRAPEPTAWKTRAPSMPPTPAPMSSTSPRVTTSGRLPASPSASPSSGSAPAPTASAPSVSASRGPLIKAGDRLTMSGLGEVTIGTPLATVLARGVVTKSECPTWRMNDQLRAEGVWVTVSENGVWRIQLTRPTYGTQSGAKDGMTVAGVKKIYGVGLKAETVNYLGRSREALTIRSGPTMIVFLTDAWALADTDAVTAIGLKSNDDYSVMVDGCA